MNKKIAKTIACASAMTAVVAGSCLLFACNDSTTSEQKLAAPVISIDGSVVSWSAVEHATSYDVTVGANTVDTTDTSYTISVSETGEYKVSVVAKTTESGWQNSDKSNELVYKYVKPTGGDEDDKTLNSRLKLDAQPAKAVYFLDEKASAVDLTGIRVKAVYSDSSEKELAVADLKVKNTVDLTTVGQKKVEVEYEDSVGGGTAVCDFRIQVKQRTVADLDAAGTEYVAVENEFSATAEKYKISDKKLTAVTDMTGASLAVTTDDDGTYVAASAFAKSGAKLVNADGEFLNIIVASYIRTADDFKAINDNLDGYYILQNNLDFGAIELGTDGLNRVWDKNSQVSLVGVAPLREDKNADGSVFELDFSGDENLAVAGKPFTGTFDGKGYNINHISIAFIETTPAYTKEAQTLSIFGYIGEGGKVCNFTLGTSMIKSGKNSGLIAAANLGTIENVVIDDDCVLDVSYQYSAVIAAYNGGAINNCVSYAQNVKGAEEGAATRVAAVSADDATEKNVFLNDDSNKAETLGAGWFYIDGYGTVYGNDSYNKLIAYDKVWYVGQDVKLTVYSKTGATDSFTATTWGIGGHNADNPAFTVTGTGENGAIELTLTWADSITSDVLAAGSKFVFAVGNGDVGNFGTFAITVGTPYTLDIENVATANITCAKDTELNLGAIDLTVSLSDGTTKIVHPTKIKGEFDSSSDGAKNVVLVYVENGNEFEIEATVTVFTPSASINAGLKQGVDKVVIAYNNGWAIANTDFSEFFYVTDGSAELTDYTVSVNGNAYGKDITFTISKDGYADDVIVVDAYLGVGSKAAFNAINTNLAGWYILTADIDFENDARAIGQMPLIQNDDGTSFGWAGSFKEGVPFTGVFDGNGKTISRFTFSGYEGGFNADTFGFGIFAYIGEGGKVYNFTISNSAMKASNYTSFVAGLNCGEISNVTISSDCSIMAQYGVCAAYSAINYGTIKDSVCYVTTNASGGALTAVNSEWSSPNGTVTNVTITAGTPGDSL